MTKYLGMLLLVFSFAHSTLASEKCAEIAKDLKAMQEAQVSVKQSLVDNHEAFATVLEEYSGILENSAGLGQSVSKATVSNMNESAKAFRARGQSARKLNQKLNQASDRVIAKAIECLEAGQR